MQTQVSEMPATEPRDRATTRPLFESTIVRQATIDSVRKLDPRVQARNPVMFVVLVGSVLTTVLFFRDLGSARANQNVFSGLVAAWLWFTVLFANFAEAMAEGRGKAQAATLRRTRAETMANRRRADGEVEHVPSTQLTVDDVVVVTAGEVIPSDGEIIEGIASVDESAITGESAPVIREAGGDRSAVTGGTRVLSDKILVRITARAGETFLDRMIALVEGASRKKTPNEIALNTLLAVLTIIFLLATVTLQPFAMYAHAEQKVIVLVALLVCLIPTTIGALLSAIGIAGMDRLVQHNVLAMSGRAVEAAGDCSTLLLDKTGTITLGNRQAAEFLALPDVPEERLAAAAQLASLADETPEGRSIVVLAKERYEIRERDVHDAELVPFTAQTRMSGLDLEGRSVRKGAADSVKRWVVEQGGQVPDGLDSVVEGVATAGGTPLVVTEGVEILGVVHLKDIVKTGIRRRFDQLRSMGIRTVMITGDNPLTAQAIATEAGVDDFLAEATPEDKLDLIRREQAGGRLVAMTGDGTNDAPALAQADVGVAMNTGTQAAKEAGNMVDLDSNPTKLIEIVEIGKQLLITRGALTTFSVANDVAKYFAIIPAMFMGVFPALNRINIMHLQSPRSAILSAVIFNALVIVGVDPAVAPGREVPGRERRLDAAAQPADLRPRRHHRAVHRDQAHRPPHHGTGSLLMRRQLLPALGMMLVFTVLLGVAYPLLVTGIGQTAFNGQGQRLAGRGRREGRRLEVDRSAVHRCQVLPPPTLRRRLRPRCAGRRYRLARVQPRADRPPPDRQRSRREHVRSPRTRTRRRRIRRAYPCRRPTSTTSLSPTRHGNPVYEKNADGTFVCNADTVPQRVLAYRAENGLSDKVHVPVDAVTASGSGLDPEISVANARLQAGRVAKARGLDKAVVLQLVDRHTDQRALGFLESPV